MNRHCWETRYEALKSKQEECIRVHPMQLECIECCFIESFQATQALVKEAQTVAFTSPAEKIYFLKIVKPKFAAQIVLFRLMYHAAVFAPIEEVKVRAEFWFRERQRLVKYITKHSDLYEYWRLKRTDKDREYFVWTNGNESTLAVSTINGIMYDIGDDCETDYGNKIATIIALEKYTEFVNGKLAEMGLCNGKN